MKKIGMKLIALVLLMTTIFLTPCGVLASEEISNEPTKGFIWEATNGDNSIYLVGTMHPAPNDVNFFNDKINNIIKETDGLATEIDLTDEKNIKELQDYMINNSYLKNGEIKDLLVGDEEKILYNILLDYKIDYSDISKLNPYGLMMTLSGKSNISNGLTGPIFDLLLEKKYKELNRKIISLESVQDQMEALNANIDSLREYIDKYDRNSIKKGSEYSKELFEGYKNGDFNVGEKSIKKQQENKDVYKKRLVDRNIKMADKIDDLAKNNKKYVVAVGYLHYFGEDSIIKLLEKKGYVVKAIN